MRKLIGGVLAVLVAVFFSLGTVLAQALSFPPPTGYVNDFAGVLSAEAQDRLEADLVSLEAETGVEVVVVTVESLQGTTEDDFAVRLFEEWGIGKAKKNNGVLVLVAPQERRLKVEVGYGLEGTITDGTAGAIRDDYFFPAFREGDYDRGVKTGVEAIAGLIRGDPTVIEEVTSTPSEADTATSFMNLLIFGFILIVYLSSYLARSKEYRTGGIIGAVLGLVFGLILAQTLLVFLLVVFLGGWGFFLDYILSRNYKQRRKSGQNTSFWNSWGGFSGGFGGGSSGGGGAGGGW